MMEIAAFDAQVPVDAPTTAGLVRTRSNGGTTGRSGSGVVDVPRAIGPARTVASVREAERDLPVLAEVDVLVCGGGPAGTGAAIGAARTGASTLLIERYGYLGGMATAGLVVPHFNPTLNGGVNAQIIDRLRERAAWGAEFWRISFDPERWKHVSEDLVLESGADLLFHTQVVAAIVESGVVRGAVVETKSGRFAILARAVVDCTGDADLAARAGADYVKGREGDGLMQSMTTMFRMGGVDWVQRGPGQLRDLVEDAIDRTGDDYRLPFEFPWSIHLPNPGEVAVQLAHIRGVDGTDVRDLTRAEIDGRRQVTATSDFLIRSVPEFRNAYLIETAHQVGVRETRRVVGDYTITLDDVLSGRHFDDGIASVSFPIDIHESDDDRQRVEEVGQAPRGAYDIPYRSLLPAGLQNLLVAGRCISGSYEAHASYRVKGPCMAMGQAAGAAAGLSAIGGIPPRDLPFPQLAEALGEQDVRLWPRDVERRLPQVAGTEHEHMDQRKPKRLIAYRGPG